MNLFIYNKINRTLGGKRMSKKIASILMSLVLSVSLISCGNGKTAEDASKENNTAQEEQKKDAMDAYLTGEWAENRTLDELKKSI